MTKLVECGELRLDFSQGRFQGGAASGIGGSLREDVFALKVEGLAAAFGCGTVLGSKAPFCFTH